jgi:hypothetical protein
MKRYLFLLTVALAMAACDHGPTPAEKAAADARDIAMVEAAQERHPPIQPISPEPITVSELEKLDLLAANCGFVPAGARDPVVLATPKQAVMLVDGQPQTLAGDSAGPAGPVGTWQRYVGKARSLRIAKAGGDGVEPGADALEWPATLTVRDEFDRIVFTRNGKLRCGN